MPKVGDVVTRIWGGGYMESEMRVSAVDDEFIYCDAMRAKGATEWNVLPLGSMPWKFDVKYGVETDESRGWGMEPYGRNVVLTRIRLIRQL